MSKGPAPSSADRDPSDDWVRALHRFRKIAKLMDSSITLPGGATIGLDGFLGMIPVIGDLGTSIVSAYIIFESRRLGAPFSVLLRMSLNVLIDTAVGSIPVLGDVFDFVWKANERNVRLLERRLGLEDH